LSRGSEPASYPANPLASYRTKPIIYPDDSFLH
jgi:hypothetical protein